MTPKLGNVYAYLLTNGPCLVMRQRGSQVRGFATEADALDYARRVAKNQGVDVLICRPPKQPETESYDAYMRSVQHA